MSWFSMRQPEPVPADALEFWKLCGLLFVMGVGTSLWCGAWLRIQPAQPMTRPIDVTAEPTGFSADYL